MAIWFAGESSANSTLNAPGARGLHSSTCRLIVSAFYGIGGVFWGCLGCLGGVYVVSGDFRGFLGCIWCEVLPRLSREVDEWKPLPGAGISPVDVRESRTGPPDGLATAGGNSSETMVAHSVDVTEVIIAAAAAAVASSTSAATATSAAAAASASAFQSKGLMDSTRRVIKRISGPGFLSYMKAYDVASTIPVMDSPCDGCYSPRHQTHFRPPFLQLNHPMTWRALSISPYQLDGRGHYGVATAVAGISGGAAATLDVAVQVECESKFSQLMITF